MVVANCPLPGMGEGEVVEVCVCFIEILKERGEGEGEGNKRKLICKIRLAEEKAWSWSHVNNRVFMLKKKFFHQHVNKKEILCYMLSIAQLLHLSI